MDCLSVYEKIGCKATAYASACSLLIVVSPFMYLMPLRPEREKETRDQKNDCAGMSGMQIATSLMAHRLICLWLWQERLRKGKHTIQGSQTAEGRHLRLPCHMLEQDLPYSDLHMPLEFECPAYGELGATSPLLIADCSGILGSSGVMAELPSAKKQAMISRNIMACLDNVGPMTACRTLSSGRYSIHSA